MCRSTHLTYEECAKNKLTPGVAASSADGAAAAAAEATDEIADSQESQEKIVETPMPGYWTQTNKTTWAFVYTAIP